MKYSKSAFRALLKSGMFEMLCALHSEVETNVMTDAEEKLISDEYELIKQKKSKLSAAERKKIVQYFQRKEKTAS